VFHFYALPVWALGPPSKKPNAPQADPLVPSIATEPGVVLQALDRAELAGMRAAVRAQRALEEAGPHKVFARPPNDLPALLRLADELVRIAQQDQGHPARIWQCSCGTRYGVPEAVLVPMSLTCEKCGRQIELEPQTTTGQEPVDPQQERVNAYRGALSEFFREAMARGWPVLVKKAP
jgi:hypothetical protein